MIAQRVGQRVAVGGGSATPPPIPGARGAATATKDPHACAGGERFARMFDRVGDRLGAFGDRVADLGVHALPRNARRDAAPPGDPSYEIGDPLCDPLSRRQRRTLALIMICVVSTAAGFLSPLALDGAAPAVFATFFGAAGAAAGMLLAGRRILPQMNGDSGMLRKLASGGTAAALMIIFSVFVFGAVHGQDQKNLSGTALAVIAALLLIRPPDLSPSRPERVMFGPAVGAAAIGFGLSFPFGGSAGLAIGILGGAYLLAQVLSPWDAFAAKRRAEMEDWDEDEDGPRPAPPPRAATAAAATAPAARARDDWSAVWNAAAAESGEAPTMAWPHGQGSAGSVPQTTSQRNRRPVPLLMRYVWLGLTIAAVTVGIVTVVHAAAENLHGEELALTVGSGVGSLLLGVLSFAKMFQKTFRTWWSYAGRWIGAWMCVQSILLAAFMLGEGRGDTAACVFFMVFPALLVPVLMFVRFSSGATPPAADAATGAAPPPLPTPASPAAPQAMPRGDARVGFEPTPPRRAKGSKRRRRHEEPGQPLVVRLFGFVRDMAVGAVVTWLLLIALVVGVVMAMDVPGMLAAGVPDPGIPAHITQGLGFDGWPHLFRIVGNGVGLATLLLAALVLIVARRRTYGLHMMRAMAGVAVFGLSLMLLGRALSGGEWHRVPGGAALEASSFESADARDPGYVGPQRVVIHMGHGEGVRDMRDVRASFFASLEHFLSDARPGFVTWSGCVGLLAIIMICWPARRTGDRRGARQVAVHQNFGPAVYAPPAPAPAPASAPAAAAAGESN